MAKELHSPIGDADHTMETDIWAFGMVICVRIRDSPVLTKQTNERERVRRSS